MFSERENLLLNLIHDLDHVFLSLCTKLTLFSFTCQALTASG